MFNEATRWVRLSNLDSHLFYFLLKNKKKEEEEKKGKPHQSKSDSDPSLVSAADSSSGVSHREEAVSENAKKLTADARD